MHPLSRPSLYTCVLALARPIVRMLGSAQRFTHGLRSAFHSRPLLVTQALLWPWRDAGAALASPWRCLLLGAALILLCLTLSSFLCSGGRIDCSVFCAATMGCFAIFIVGTGLTTEAICALPSIIFTAVQAWGMQPDSMHSAVATTAAGLRGAFALLSLSAGMVLSSPTWCMSWFSSRSASDSPPAELMTIAARQRAMRTVRARRNVSGRAAAHHLLLGLAVVVLALASVDSGAAAAKLRPWRQWPDVNGLAIGKPSAAEHTMTATDDGNLWLYSSTLFKLDLQAKQWTSMTTSGRSPNVMCRYAMAPIGNVLYLHGGYTSNDGHAGQ